MSKNEDIRCIKYACLKKGIYNSQIIYYDFLRRQVLRLGLTSRAGCIRED